MQVSTTAFLSITSLFPSRGLQSWRSETFLPLPQSLWSHIIKSLWPAARHALALQYCRRQIAINILSPCQCLAGHNCSSICSFCSVKSQSTRYLIRRFCLTPAMKISLLAQPRANLRVSPWHPIFRFGMSLEGTVFIVFTVSSGYRDAKIFLCMSAYRKMQMSCNWRECMYGWWIPLLLWLCVLSS